MNHPAKSISVHQLQAAINKALEAAKSSHPQTHALPALPAVTDGFIYRPWWICGLPVPWPLAELGTAAGFAARFSANLEKDPAVAPLAIDGKIAPALYVTGGQVSLGFVPGEASITE